MLLTLLLLTAADPPTTIIQGRSAAGNGSFSADSKLVLTPAGRDAILWDIATGRELRRFAGLKDVTQALVSPTGKHVAILSEGLRVFDLESGATIAARDDWNGLSAIAFSPDGKQLAAHEMPKKLHIVDLVTLQVWEIGKSQPSLRVALPIISQVALSPDGRFALAGALLIDINTGAVVRRLEGKAHSTHFVGFSGDGLSLYSVTSADERVTGKNEYALRTWDLVNARLAKTLFLPGKLLSDGGVSPILMTSDRKRLAIEVTKISKGDAHIDDIEDGKIVRTLANVHFSAGFNFSPDSKTIAQSKYAKGWLNLWLSDVQSGKPGWAWKQQSGAAPAT